MIKLGLKILHQEMRCELLTRIASLQASSSGIFKKKIFGLGVYPSVARKSGGVPKGSETQPFRLKSGQKGDRNDLQAESERGRHRAQE